MRCAIQANGDQPARLRRGEVVQTDDPAFPRRCTFTIEDRDLMRELSGELGHHLKIIDRALGVRMQQRGAELIISGQDAPISGARGVTVGSVDLAAHILDQLAQVVGIGYRLLSDDVDRACRLVRADPDVRLVELYRDTIAIGVGKRQVHPRSPRQRDYLHAIRDHDLVFGIGPAGTGKTYLAMAMAVASLFRSEVRRIVLCRPAVEAGEKLGFLPGDMVEKVNPYLRPLYDALHDLVGSDRSGRLVHKGVIEVAPLAFMRGRTLSDAFVILDEAQNTTPAQMKMFLTRIGLGSRVVVTGDITQVDLPPGHVSGLVHALGLLRTIPEIAVVKFSHIDVVRHPLVSAIVQAYDQADRRKRHARED